MATAIKAARHIALEQKVFYFPMELFTKIEILDPAATKLVQDH